MTRSTPPRPAHRGSRRHRLAVRPPRPVGRDLRGAPARTRRGAGGRGAAAPGRPADRQTGRPDRADRPRPAVPGLLLRPPRPGDRRPVMRGSIDGLASSAPLGMMLPAVFADDDLAQRFVAGLDEVLAPILNVLDCLDTYFTPSLAPADFTR